MILFHKQSELSATAANLFIAGDFNLPTIDWSSTDYLNIKNYADNSAAYHFVETLVNSSLCQIVSEPTRFRQNQNPSTLDLILVNDPALVSQVDYLSPIGKSDHITLLSTIQLLVCEIPKKVTKLVKRVNYNKLKNDLE
jgi:endonuclease/exonuclease/phosphatase family metal-dependent hydrolase